MQNKPNRQRANSIAGQLTCLLSGMVLEACALLKPTNLPSETPGQVLLEPAWEESGQVNLPVNQGDSPLNIVHTGFEKWLSQNAQTNTPLEASVEDYRVDLIEAVSDPFFAGEYDFVFRVEYSVQPASTGLGRWIAGDGREGQGGWVVGKLHFVGVRIESEIATLFILGPCPTC